jgi:uracil-DNA glycosylase
MSKLMIVGEAWGREEEEVHAPFVGPTGRFLRGTLREVGIDPKECYFTNVFNFRPQPSNDIRNLCGPRSEGIPLMPALASSKYVRIEYAPELTRLQREIEVERPTMILALGGTAAWALLGKTGISKIRGTPVMSTSNIKVFPTYHPTAILRDWRLRPILIADLHKAKRELAFPEIVRPQRTIWIEPDLNDLYSFEDIHITPSPNLSIDIETKFDQITCIGFAPRTDVALVVPFRTTRGNYWPTLVDELAAWNWVKRICALSKSIVGQNFLYDIQFLWRKYGITVPHFEDDTMLLHHALYPEMKKDLGFLGSIYTNEASWKVNHRKKDTVKEED